MDREYILNHLKERYGIPEEVFREYEFLVRGRKIWIYRKGLWVPRGKLESIGMIALRIGKQLKPTTNFIQMFGKYASKNVVEITSEEDMKRFVNGKDIYLSISGRGYVFVKYKDDFLGCGFLRDGVILNLIPNDRRIKID